MKDFDEVLPFILRLSLFQDFSRDNENDVRVLRILYENFSVKHFKTKDLIIKEGDYGDLFYILLDGCIRIYRKTPAGDKIALANLSGDQGIFFGETALISKDCRSATVEAATDCKVLEISSKKFHAICEKEPVLGYRVIMKIAGIMANTISDCKTDKAILYEALFNEIEYEV